MRKTKLGKFVRILSASLALTLVAGTCAVVNPATTTTVSAKKNKKGQEYTYPSDARAAGIPEKCFSNLGTYKSSGSEGDHNCGYYVQTYKNSRDGSYIASKYIAWKYIVNCPHDSKDSYDAKLECVASNGWYKIKPANNTAPMITIDLNCWSDPVNPDVFEKVMVKTTGRDADSNLTSIVPIVLSFSKTYKLTDTLSKILAATLKQADKEITRDKKSNSLTMDIFGTDYSKYEVARQARLTANKNITINKKGHGVILSTNTDYNAKTTPKSIRLAKNKTRLSKVEYKFNIVDMYNDPIYTVLSPFAHSYTR